MSRSLVLVLLFGLLIRVSGQGSSLEEMDESSIGSEDDGNEMDENGGNVVGLRDDPSGSSSDSFDEDLSIWESY
ncbi:Hypp8749 [Branchiostoma lanceolatum]|uniref:Hypp8749 protein n=1 Tax=Branchiostoma lanceolatum TaxID=7740 RepID=A0A8J9ZAF4_BRALA|nr:Hypp8749 [Branchiostoma lanceolatum]